MKLVIGLVGEKGSGKQTFSDFLIENLDKKYKVEHVRFSDLLVETLNLWAIPTTRFNLQHLAIVMNKGYGEGTLTRGVIKKIENLKAEVIIIDGLRWMSDLEMLRSFSGSILVYITAKTKLRYERLKKNSSKVNEQGVSFAQFMREEKEKTEVSIPKIGAQADFKIENNGSLKELKAQVERVLTELL